MKVENDVGEVDFGAFDERGGLPPNLRAGEGEVIDLNQVDGLMSDFAASGGSGVRKGNWGGASAISPCRPEKSVVMTLVFLFFGVGFDEGSEVSA